MYTDCCPFPQHKRVCITCTSFYELLFSQSTPKYKNMNMCMYMCISMVSDVLSMLLKLISSFISYEFYQIYMTNCRISHILNNNISKQVINAHIKTEERFEFDKFPFDRRIK